MSYRIYVIIIHAIYNKRKKENGQVIGCDGSVSTAISPTSVLVIVD